MVRIRLRRVGGKKQPAYRIVVTDRRNPRDGRFIEKIGYYNPRTQPSTVEVNEERALYWLDKGAQPSDAVQRLLKNLGTMERYERLRAGEPLETLLADAETAAAARPEVDPRTRRDEEVAAKSSKRAKAKAEALAEAEAALAEPEVEDVEEAEEEAEEVVAAEAEVVEAEAAEEAEEEAEEIADAEAEVVEEEAAEEAEEEAEEVAAEEAEAKPEAEDADEEPAEGDE
jgi:small subunit ribosomal protein S16